ncbi:MAG TPA: N-acetylmuramoyl-L-alanine amidase [Paracoccaceae bacterium]|nr:N-acetylmuramoyl-L-alanine amidase [Paracoccaceae bacterium]
MINHPSPNFGPRRDGARPDMVILHYTGMESAGAAIERLSDPKAEVSAHYLVDIDGSITSMVAEDQRASHAGVSAWGDVRDVNSRSIGIELANPGHCHGYPPFPEPQMAALSSLLGGILTRWSIPPERVLGHACVSPGRKIDPGEKFDWRRLAHEGLAIWLDAPAGSGSGGADAARFREAARRFGYVPDGEEGWSPELLSIWQSFLMRFRPGEAGAPPHAAGIRHLEALAAKYPVRLDATEATAAIEPAHGSS